MTDRRKKAPVPHTALPRALLAQPGQCGGRAPPEHSDGRSGHDRKKKDVKTQPESHVTQHTWLHELVSAEIGQAGSPVFYGIPRTRVWTVMMDTPPLAGQRAANFAGQHDGANRDEKLSRRFPQGMSTPQPDGMNRYRTNPGRHSGPERSPE